MKKEIILTCEYKFYYYSIAHIVNNNSKSKNYHQTKISIIVPNKVDIGSDGNTMPLHLYKRVIS